MNYFFPALACVLLAAGPASGQTWPERPIRLVVSFAARWGKLIRERNIRAD